jgi:hypothetical protein
MNNNNFAKTKISVLDLAIVRDGGTESDTLKTVLISHSMLKNGAMIDFG